MIVSACHGDDVSIGRRIVALPVSSVTPSDNGAVGSQSDTVKLSASDGDEVRIRRSIVALTVFVVTPSDHGAIASKSDAVTIPA